MSPVDTEVTSVPKFSDEAHNLAKIASNLGKDGLISVMKISEKLADLNLQRFKSFGNQDKKAAVFAFAGDTYQGFDASTINSDGLRWAQDHLRILSGLYGVLRPFDEIEPYRLEMGSKFNIGDKKFTVTCQPGEESALEFAAGLLNDEASYLISQIGQLSEQKLLLMSALMLADKMATTTEKMTKCEKALDEALNKIQRLEKAESQFNTGSVDNELLIHLENITKKAEELADKVSS